MPPKKKQLPAPIDRPLSRAYLREFTGWSTAYPPGISDPTSLRIMENVQICRDGSARVRPGLRYASFEDDGTGVLAGMRQQMVGTHEVFFLNDGTKAYLFAVREDDGYVGFRVLVSTELGMVVKLLTDPGVDFTIEQGPPILAFSPATTYVKYLQIDNKIFALSNQSESMRLFTVGSNKTARTLSSILVPEWNVADKLTVVHPLATWTNGATPASVRTNKITSPDFTGTTGWTPSSTTELVRSTSTPQAGTYSGRMGSKPDKTNYCINPLRNPSTDGTYGWYVDQGTDSINTAGNECRFQANAVSGGALRNCRGGAPAFAVEAGVDYQWAFDITDITNATAIKVRWAFENSSGAVIGTPVELAVSVSLGRKGTSGAKAPAGAVRVRTYLKWEAVTGAFSAVAIKNVLFIENIESTTFFDGASGTNYFWTGTAHRSTSVYHPPANIEIYTYAESVSAAKAHCASVYARAGTTVRTVTQWIEWRSATAILASITTPLADAVGSYTRITTTGTAPALTTRARVRITIPTVARGEYHYVDSALFESGVSVAGTYFDGGTPNTSTLTHKWTGTAYASTSTASFFSIGSTIPGPVSPKTVNTLISSDATKNVYNFGFFYTFSNEIGESAPSQVTTIRAQRGWAMWRWETPNAAGEPSGTATSDPGLCADQLVASMPVDVFNTALDQGATNWNLYMFTWSDQEPVPVSAMLIARRDLMAGALHGSLGWLRATPQMADAGTSSAPLPRQPVRNYSDPSLGAQGIVAADRMVVVGDRANPALVRWTSNQMGSYTDFSASKGGGYKTLTSGNLYIPACVKLWQNPQSADTLTILCLGVDGYSTGYYMSPAQVASQSEAVNIMGFEETTATPGTTSPYGVEVVNNALYHPLDEMLMKSTANNYNIAHKSMTDQIENMWRKLDHKIWIVSSQHDNRIYLLVYNPDGEALLPGCFGNEVWVFDAQAEKGNWSRWLTQGHSLRKAQQGGQVVMSLLRPEGMFYFDETYDRDDVVVPVTRAITQRFIPWRLETNTQGANRAHDAWAHLQQVNLTIGNFQGKMRFGIRSWDENGKPIDISKVTEDVEPPIAEQFDVEDFLLVRRNLREWFLYAESVLDDLGETAHSYGQLNLVQYRYTPISVNVGYEYGSVETFEYGRAVAGAESYTTNGVPVPYIETRRP